MKFFVTYETQIYFCNRTKDYLHFKPENIVTESDQTQVGKNLLTCILLWTYDEPMTFYFPVELDETRFLFIYHPLPIFWEMDVEKYYREKRTNLDLSRLALVQHIIP